MSYAVFFCDILPANVYGSILPFYDLANLSIFPFAEHLRILYDVPLVVDLLLIVIIPVALVYAYSFISFGVLVSLGIFDKTMIQVVHGLFVGILSYLSYVILVHIMDWPILLFVSMFFSYMFILVALTDRLASYGNLNVSETDSIKYLFKYSLISVLFFTLLYLLCGYYYDSMPSYIPDNNKFPLYGFANNILFPFSENIRIDNDFSFLGKLWRIIVLPMLFSKFIVEFFGGILLALDCFSNNKCASYAGLCSVFFLYCMWLVFYNIYDWPIFTAIFIAASCIASVSMFEENLDGDRCPRCSSVGVVKLVRTQYGSENVDLKYGFDLENKTSYMTLKTATPYTQHFRCGSCKSEWTQSGVNTTDQREDFSTLEGFRTCKWWDMYDELKDENGNIITRDMIKVPKPRRRTVERTRSSTSSSSSSSSSSDDYNRECMYYNSLDGCCYCVSGCETDMRRCPCEGYVYRESSSCYYPLRSR